jgi:hypothetical protein
MVADNTQSVFVPYDAEARPLIVQLNVIGVLHLDLRRRLQRYMVGLYQREFQVAAQRGAVYEVRPGSNLWICPEGFYDEKLGFVMEPSPSQMVQ